MTSQRTSGSSISSGSGTIASSAARSVRYRMFKYSRLRDLYGPLGKGGAPSGVDVCLLTSSMRMRWRSFSLPPLAAADHTSALARSVTIPLMTTGAGGPDFYAVEDLLTDEEREIRDRVHAFCQAEIVPNAARWWEAAEFPFELVPKIAALGVAGHTIEGYGCPGMSTVAAGLVAQEWARADGSIGTFYGVHSFLAMQSIAALGSDEQRERWLPPMARIDLVGAFGLTEPEHGSDAVALETSARRDGDEYVLDGRKKWIGNASWADLVLIWARGEDGNVGGYVVEKGTPGFEASVMTGKTSLRAVWQAEIDLHDVRVPAENRLPGCRSFKDVAAVLSRTRFTVSWRALGLAI